MHDTLSICFLKQRIFCRPFPGVVTASFLRQLFQMLCVHTKCQVVFSIVLHKELEFLLQWVDFLFLVSNFCIGGFSEEVGCICVLMKPVDILHSLL